MDLEDELNRLFKDERLDMSVAPDAETHVVAGAKRVKRRRVALMSAAGVLSLAVLGGGAFILAQPSPQSNQVANPPTDLPLDNASSAPSEAPPSPSATMATSSPTAPPTSRPADSTPGGPVRPPAATTSTPPPIAPAATLGPNGFRGMLLGMTAEELVATGQVQGTQKPPPASGCTSYTPKSGSGTVWVSSENVVVGFVMRSGVATPERVGIGSTQDAVKAAYPDLSGNSAKVPGNASATYQFAMTGGKVSGISLLAVRQDCVS